MIVPHAGLRTFLYFLHSQEIDWISLNACEDRQVDRNLEQMRLLGSVTKMVPKPETAFSDCRALIDASIESFLDTINKLSSTVGMVLPKYFRKCAG